MTTVHSDGLNADLQTLDYNQSNGTLARATDANGNTTSLNYDAAGNLTAVAPPAPRKATHFSYDSLSRVLTKTDGNGNTLHYYYDKLDRVVEVDRDRDDGSATLLATYQYNADGNLTEQRTGGVTLTSSYDTWNTSLVTTRRRQDSSGGDTTTRYGYDKAGNMTSLDDGSGNGATSYAFDAANRLTSMTDPAGQTTTIGYDANDNRTSITFASGAAEYPRYDDSDRETRVRVRNPGNGLLLENTYRYTDDTGNDTSKIQAKTDATGTVDYDYDGGGRMVKAAGQNFDYDNANNMTGRNGQRYTVNAADQQTETQGQTSVYDGAGNLSSTQNPDSTLTHSATNQLTRAEPDLIEANYDTLKTPSRTRSPCIPTASG